MVCIKIEFSAAYVRYKILSVFIHPMFKEGECPIVDRDFTSCIYVLAFLDGEISCFKINGGALGVE